MSKRYYSDTAQPNVRRVEHEYVRSIVDDVEDYMTFPCYSGTTRKTYVGNMWVYKVSHDYCDWGVSQNEYEASIYQDMVDGKDVRVPVAECYLLRGGDVLKMRRVQTLFDHVNTSSFSRAERDKIKLPRWVQWVDSDQVGYLHGELVAYDV